MWPFKKTTVVLGALLGFFLGFICFDAALAAPMISFEASSSVVPVNSATTLTWTVTDAVSCVASGAWSGSKNPVGGSEGTGNLTAGMKTFTLTCEDALLETTAINVVVTVADPPTLEFLAVGDNTIDYNTSLNLAWSSTGANSCKKEGDWTGTTTLSGNESTGNLISEKTFGIRCSGDGGEVYKDITVTISNPTLQVELDFSADSYFLDWGDKASLHWTATNADFCTASNAWTGSKDNIAGDFETSELTDDKVYTLYCANESGSNVTKNIPISVTPKVPLQVTVTATTPDANIEYSTKATIEWTSTNASYCKVYDAGWSSALSTSYTYTSKTLTNDRTFTVKCYGDIDASDTVFINVAPNPVPAPDLVLEADDDIIDYKTGTNLSWTTTDTTTLTASGGWSGSKSIPSGTEATGDLLTDTVYKLKAIGSGGSKTVSEDITVGDPIFPPDVTIWADDSDIAYNEITTVRWTSTDADWCKLSYDSTTLSVAINGSRSTGKLTTGKTYKVECGNSFNSTPVTTTVTVTPTGVKPTITMTADDNPVEYGTGTNVRWTTANATACYLNGGNVQLNHYSYTGSLYAPKTYTLSCYGPGGFNSDELTVDVTGAPIAVPVLNFWADEYDFYESGSTTLHWEAVDADECWASSESWSGDKSIPTGSELTKTLTETTLYEISCKNINGTVSDSLIITVGAANDVEIEFYADNTDIELNGSVNVTWNGKNANVCEAYSDPSVSGWPLMKRAADEEASTTVGPFTEYSTKLHLHCWNYTSEDWATVTITAGDPPPSITMDAPTPVAYNTPATIAWFADYSESCTASAIPAEPTWSGTRATSGLQQTSNLKQDTRFYLECVNADGVKNSTNRLVKVGSSNLTAPQISFTSNKYIATEGEAYDLSWNVTNATWCEANSVPDGLWSDTKNNVAGSESLIFSGDKQELVLTCGNSAGSMSAIVTVNKGGTELLLPSISFWADQMSLPVGGKTMLRWSTENATTCNASSVPVTSWAGIKTAGSGQQQTDALTVATRFELTCKNIEGGERTAFVDVNVGGPTPEVVVDFWSVGSDYDISLGESVTLAWTSENASYCYAIDPNGLFNGGQATSGSISMEPTVSTTYMLVCGNDGGQKTLTIPISVAKVIVCPSPARIIEIGNAIQLRAYFKQDADVAFSCSDTSGADEVTSGYGGFSIDWDSADSDVVEVNATGLATGLAYTELNGGPVTITAEYREAKGERGVIVSPPPVTCWKCSESKTCFSDITFPIDGNCPDETFDTMHECAKACRKPVDWQEVGL